LIVDKKRSHLLTSNN